jgi:hypothetical protein
MNGIWETVTSISTPLILGGLVVVVMFFIFKTIFSKNIIPQLNQTTGGKVVLRIVNFLFILSLVAIILGFVGYAIAKYYPPLDSDYVSMGIPEEMPLELVVQLIAEEKDVTINFNKNCNDSVKNATLNPKGYEGGSVKEFVENLKQGVKGESIYYSVIKEGELRYEIVCR